MRQLSTLIDQYNCVQCVCMSVGTSVDVSISCFLVDDYVFPNISPPNCICAVSIQSSFDISASDIHAPTFSLHDDWNSKRNIGSHFDVDPCFSSMSSFLFCYFVNSECMIVCGGWFGGGER